MGDMKCPFCGQELKNINFIWFCENESCRAYDWTMEEAAWQELIRTRKALDVAVKAMKSAEYFRLDHCMCCGHDPQKDEVYIKLRNALEQITALEQKQKNK